MAGMLANGKASPGKKVGAWLPLEVLTHRAWIELTPGAKLVLVALAAQYRGLGRNNGDLSLSVAVLRPFGITSPATIWSAEKQLRAHGLIIRTRQGMKLRNTPSLYALTWRAIDKCDGKLSVSAKAAPSNRWREYRGQPLDSAQ